MFSPLPANLQGDTTQEPSHHTRRNNFGLAKMSRLFEFCGLVTPFGRKQVRAMLSLTQKKSLTEKPLIIAHAAATALPPFVTQPGPRIQATHNLQT